MKAAEYPRRDVCGWRSVQHEAAQQRRFSGFQKGRHLGQKAAAKKRRQ